MFLSKKLKKINLLGNLLTSNENLVENKNFFPKISLQKLNDSNEIVSKNNFFSRTKNSTLNSIILSNSTKNENLFEEDSINKTNQINFEQTDKKTLEFLKYMNNMNKNFDKFVKKKKINFENYSKQKPFTNKFKKNSLKINSNILTQELNDLKNKNKLNFPKKSIENSIKIFNFIFKLKI